ncbi:MAG TPA: M28 family peptidase [Actinomycetes bacterium]|nr:M28 family peptidase [Actinomycetes bacterium]
MKRLALVLVVASCAACSMTEDPGASSAQSPSPSLADTTGATSPSTTTSPSETSKPDRPVRFDGDRAFADVRTLAGRIGPREATSDAFTRAAALVHKRFDRLGYEVSRQRFRVPAGNSWGIDVPSGMSSNVVAAPPGFDENERYLIVGAHLDTVPQAPGAEDNASGVSVVMELARVAASEATRLPVIFVAFGAEEPRGEGDDWHHFGSQAFTARMTPAERRNLVAMVALDRVGVGSAVPICGGGLTNAPVVSDLRAAARRANVPFSSCGLNQSSDHWSFERAGLPAARLGSTAYAAYHDASDVPNVVSTRQLQRTGDVAWEFISR